MNGVDGDNNNAAAHQTWWRTSDAIFGVLLLTGVALHLFVPLVAVAWLPPIIRVALGLLLATLGLGLVIAGKRGLRKADQPTAPGQATTKIVSSEIYGYSRNPMYLGLVILQPAIGILIDNGWLIALTLPLLFALHYFLIIPEERYLTHLFGEPYRLYMSRVRRWLYAVMRYPNLSYTRSANTLHGDRCFTFGHILATPSHSLVK